MLLIADTLREILKGLPVAIYGSGAQALLEIAHKHHVEKLPNDIDIATKDLASLTELLVRMEKDPQHFQINPKGIYKKFSQENTQVFEGFLVIGNQEIPFECYANTRIISSESWSRLRPVLSVPVFNPEDLRATYARVLDIETRAQKDAEKGAKQIYECLDARSNPEKFRTCLEKCFPKSEEMAEAVTLFNSHKTYASFRESKSFARWTELFTGHKLKEGGRRKESIERLGNKTEQPTNAQKEAHL